MRSILAVMTGTLLAASVCAAEVSSSGTQMAAPPEAVACLQSMKDSKVTGHILFKQEGEGTVHVSGEVNGLKPGKHGFHVHEFGDLRDNEGKSAGGHFNPTGMTHGGPDSAHHHEGDMGNIDAGSDGTAKVDIKLKGVNLSAILGRSIVVHADADDLKSQPAGNSGPRVAVGVIGVAQTK